MISALSLSPSAHSIVVDSSSLGRLMLKYVDSRMRQSKILPVNLVIEIPSIERLIRCLRLSSIHCSSQPFYSASALPLFSSSVRLIYGRIK